MAARAPAARKACQSAPSRMPPQATMSSRSAAPGCCARMAASRRTVSRASGRSRAPLSARPPPRCAAARRAGRCRACHGVGGDDGAHPGVEEGGHQPPQLLGGEVGPDLGPERAPPPSRAGRAQRRRARSSVWRPVRIVLGVGAGQVQRVPRRPVGSTLEGRLEGGGRLADLPRRLVEVVHARAGGQAQAPSRRQVGRAARPGRRQPPWRRDCAGRCGSAWSASPCPARRHVPGCPGAASACRSRTPRRPRASAASASRARCPVRGPPPRGPLLRWRSRRP